MPIQVVAHGFEMTEALKTYCQEESRAKLLPLAASNFSAKWNLSVEHGEHIAHITWADGSFKGDATVHSQDMYQSIRQSTKKALEQIKRAHAKRSEARKAKRPEVVSQTDDSADDYDDYDYEEESATGT